MKENERKFVLINICCWDEILTMSFVGIKHRCALICSCQQFGSFIICNELSSVISFLLGQEKN